MLTTATHLSISCGSRPLVDRYVLRLLGERAFSITDFYETRQGVCRVTPPLTGSLALTSRDWGRAVGRVAEDVARLLGDQGRDSDRPVPTPVTGRTRWAGRGGAKDPPSDDPVALIGRRCTWCGKPVTRVGRTCGGSCDAARAAQDRSAFIASGSRRLRDLRARGLEPMTNQAREQVAARQRARQREENAWNATHPDREDPACFLAEILPTIRAVPLRELARRTGLSVSYCGAIRGGREVPHQRWWEMLSGFDPHEPATDGRLRKRMGLRARARWKNSRPAYVEGQGF